VGLPDQEQRFLSLKKCAAPPGSSDAESRDPRTGGDGRGGSGRSASDGRGEISPRPTPRRRPQGCPRRTARRSGPRRRGAQRQTVLSKGQRTIRSFMLVENGPACYSSTTPGSGSTASSTWCSTTARPRAWSGRASGKRSSRPCLSLGLADLRHSQAFREADQAVRSLS